jgi:hypothetical protein
MSAPDGPDPDVLEFGGSPPDRPRPRWQRLAWVPLGLVAVLVGVFAVNAQHHRNVAAGPSPAAAASSRPPTASPPPSASPRPSPAASAPFFLNLGHPVLQTTVGWELVARGPGQVVRIDPAGGHIAVTPIPAILSSAPVSFIAGRGWIMVRSLDSVPGYLIPDGQPARELTGALAPGPVLPGPDGVGVWTGVQDAPGMPLTLVDTDGRPLGPRIQVPADAFGSEQPDGTGYAVFDGIGGSWSARPDGIRRISTGRLVAVGPTRWVVVECDDKHTCVTVAIDRSSGARHTVAGVDPTATGRLGLVSPDGTKAALAIRAAQQPVALQIVDLRSGADQTYNVTDSVFGDGALVWSPDSAWVIGADADGKLEAFSASRSEGVRLDVGLPAITQVTVRAAPVASG